MFSSRVKVDIRGLTDRPSSATSVHIGVAKSAAFTPKVLAECRLAGVLILCHAYVAADDLKVTGQTNMLLVLNLAPSTG